MRVTRTDKDMAWLPVALSNDLELLADHAHCEKKAAASAMMLLTRYPDEPGLVPTMVELAREELEHFGEVHAMLTARGGRLGKDPGDPYVQGLLTAVRSGAAIDGLIDRLLIAALIEGRSFERLRLLGEHHPDPELRELFARFARSEARHGATFVHLARTIGAHHGVSRELVDARLSALLAHEHTTIEGLPARCAIH